MTNTFNTQPDLKTSNIRGTSHLLPGITKEATSYLVGNFGILH